MSIFKNRKRVLKISALIVLIGLFGALIGLPIYCAVAYGNKIYPNVYIDDLAVGTKTKAEALALLAGSAQSKNNSTITIIFGTETLKTLSLKSNSLFLDESTTVEESFAIGKSANVISNIADTVNAVVKYKTYNFQSELKYNKDEMNTFISDMEKVYNVAPQDAVFDYSNGRVNNIAKEVSGKKIDSDKFFADLDQAVNSLKTSSENKTITISMVDVKPNKTLAELNTFGIEDLIGEGQSNYTGSMGTRVFNVKLAASKFNGVVIPAGQNISFDDIVGDISAESGYQQAYVISGGQTVLDAGGGVCQVSTTLFRAALNTGLPILDWSAHAYRVHYYENDSLPGMDATIYSPYVDLKIGNNTKGGLLLMTEVDDQNNILKFKIWGKKDERKVEISQINVFDNVAAPAPRYQDDYTLPKGVVRQVDWSAPGAKASFTYKVTIDGKEVINREFLSVYQPWQAVFLVGQG